METAAHQYWMWMKRREILMKSSTPTWEEKAFAEDANGSLNGGCVWPPRSYSCSFCKREFRSAQALGGHMNVHRRDRARLKHSISLQNLNQQNNSLNSSLLDPKIPSHHEASATLSPSRVSGLSTQENLSENTLVSPNHTKNFLNVSSPMSVSKPLQTLEKNPREEESINIISTSLQDQDQDHDDGNHHHHNFVETNLSVGLKPSEYSCGEEAASYKRTKTAVSTLPFFMSDDQTYRLQMEVLGFRSVSKENLDLELRLGDPPKVK